LNNPPPSHVAITTARSAQTPLGVLKISAEGTYWRDLRSR